MVLSVFGWIIDVVVEDEDSGVVDFEKDIISEDKDMKIVFGKKCSIEE